MKENVAEYFKPGVNDTGELGKRNSECSYQELASHAVVFRELVLLFFTSPLKTTAWEANQESHSEFLYPSSPVSEYM